MSQPHGRSAPHNEAGENCGEAVMAALKAIGDHCEDDKAPLRTDSGMVVMVPADEMEMLSDMDPEMMDDDEVMNIISDSPWLESWVDDVCGMAGLDERVDGYERCMITYAREVMGQ